MKPMIMFLSLNSGMSAQHEKSVIERNGLKYLKSFKKNGKLRHAVEITNDEQMEIAHLILLAFE